MLFSSNPEFAIVGEAGDGLQAIQCVEERRPDLILLDLSMPRMNGIEAILKIKRKCPRTKILVLTVHKEDEYIFEALKAGADGYVLKECSHADLMVAIRNVMMGRRFLSPGISSRVIDGYLERERALETASPLGLLSSREREILKLIAEGYTNRRIADYLCISANTVGKHRSNLMKKLGLHNVAEMTNFAIKWGLAVRF